MDHGNTSPMTQKKLHYEPIRHVFVQPVSHTFEVFHLVQVARFIGQLRVRRKAKKTAVHAASQDPPLNFSVATEQQFVGDVRVINPSEKLFDDVRQPS